MVVGGILAGAVVGWALSEMLVAALTGVFDPPPAALAVPWGYLGSALALSLAAVVAVTVVGSRSLRAPSISLIREL